MILNSFGPVLPSDFVILSDNLPNDDVEGDPYLLHYPISLALLLSPSAFAILSDGLSNHVVSGDLHFMYCLISLVSLSYPMPLASCKVSGSLLIVMIEIIILSFLYIITHVVSS